MMAVISGASLVDLAHWSRPEVQIIGPEIVIGRYESM